MKPNSIAIKAFWLRLKNHAVFRNMAALFTLQMGRNIFLIFAELYSMTKFNLTRQSMLILMRRN